jgi:HSP20 family protein
MVPRLWTFNVNGDTLENIFRPFAGESAIARRPSTHATPVDVFEYEDRFECSLDLPGVAREDVKIALEDETLTIKGERPAQAETSESSRYFRHAERWAGSFARSITLPSSVDGARVAAQLKDGVLKLVLPKRDQAKPRTITIS